MKDKLSDWEEFPYPDAPLATVATPLSRREMIAYHVRKCTYRELSQIGYEIFKIEPSLDSKTSDMANVLDEWAHMVLEEGEDILEWNTGYWDPTKKVK